MLSNKKLFLFDIDGTVCQGERLIDGTMQFLEDIRQSGGQFVFITNNSTKSIQDYILKFQKLGIKTDYSNFYFIHKFNLLFFYTINKKLK